MAAADLLRAPGTPGIALLTATKAVVGEFLTWEPESVWAELRHHDVDMPECNRARLMAALTLRLMPAFYWDAVVFEKTAVALDGHCPHPDILEEATPAQLAWAVEEAAWIVREAHEPAWEVQHEPRAYAGVVLARAGFVLAPPHLDFAQTTLDRLQQDPKLRDEVATRWAGLAKQDLATLSLGETATDVQIARLAAVELHVRTRRAEVTAALAAAR